MSRIGKKLIEIPSGVTVTNNDNTVTVKGPKGELTRAFHPDMEIKIEDNVLTVSRPSENKEHRALHGTTRSLIANMVEGVSKGFERGLELIVSVTVQLNLETNLFLTLDTLTQLKSFLRLELK